MILINNVNVYGWESAIRGMRNPMNSWEKSDSNFKSPYGTLGKNDLELMKKLVGAGTDHSKFMRMINVTHDITAPKYWWKEYDTYKVGTVRNSCSTMHKIHDRAFELSDFSHEHLTEFSKRCLNNTVGVLNEYRQEYLRTKDKTYWWQLIQLLPSSYNQRATVQLNYQVLQNMYWSRRNHKLDEWVEFCKWVKRLPYSELITM